MTGSNRRHSRCKRDALPTELIARTNPRRAERRWLRMPSGTAQGKPDHAFQAIAAPA